MRTLVFSLIIFSSCCIFAQQGWYQQSSGTAEELSSVNFVNVNTGFAGGTNGVFLKTTNGGTNWMLSAVNFGKIIQIQFLNANSGFVSSDSGLYKTTNNGTNWYRILADSRRFVFKNLDSGICCDKDFASRFTSNGGTNWQVSYSIPGGITDVASPNNSTVYYCGWSFVSHPVGLYYAFIASTPFGIGNANMMYSSPMDVLSSQVTALSFASFDAGFAVGAERNVNYFYKLSGSTWSKTVISFSASDLQFVSTSKGWITAGIDIYFTSNGGSNFLRQVSPVTEYLNCIQMVNDSVGWVVGYHGTILKTNNGGITGIRNLNSEIPQEFSLYQNYPNPFNPSTKIKFDIPVGNGRDRSVLLQIYNSLGQEVAVLVNQQLQPGTYEVEWNGKDFASGVYYYSLQAGDYLETKKMLMIK